MNSSEAANLALITEKFTWPNYLVFLFVLAFSGSIGIFYGCRGSKQSSNEEFLMGNRKMEPFPVAISLLCSSLSAVTMLGYPAEVYLYGMAIGMSIFIPIPMTIFFIYFYAPVFYQLQVLSAFEYFQLRFNRRVRMVISVISVIFLIPYLTLMVYGPSVAIALVTGIHHRISVACIFGVCIFYSTLGGLKAVLWTDVFQGGVMIASMLAVVIKGFIDMGGETVWARLSMAHRTNLFNMDFDPRVRNSFFSSFFGILVFWLAAFGSSQANIQRFVSLPSVRTIKIALIYNMIALIIVLGLCTICGMLIFSNYFSCDPLSNKVVKTPEQLFPLYTMELFSSFHGLPGLFVSGITAASMSSVSSALNALSAIISQDYVKKWKPHLNDVQMGRISKLISVISGIISFCLVFIAEGSSSLLSVAYSLIGTFYGPIFGVFILGLWFPQAGADGSLIAFFCSLGFLLFLGFGSGIVSKKKLGPIQRLPLLNSGCISLGNTETNSSISGNLTFPEPTKWKDKEYGGLINLLSITHNYYPVFGIFLVISLGLFFSYIIRLWQKWKRQTIPPVSSHCFSQPILNLWKYILSKEYLEQFVHFEDIVQEKYEEDISKDTTNEKNMMDLLFEKFSRLVTWHNSVSHHTFRPQNTKEGPTNSNMIWRRSLPLSENFI